MLTPRSPSPGHADLQGAFLLPPYQPSGFQSLPGWVPGSSLEAHRTVWACLRLCVFLAFLLAIIRVIIDCSLIFLTLGSSLAPEKDKFRKPSTQDCPGGKLEKASSMVSWHTFQKEEEEKGRKKERRRTNGNGCLALSKQCGKSYFEIKLDTFYWSILDLFHIVALTLTMYLDYLTGMGEGSRPLKIKMPNPHPKRCRFHWSKTGAGWLWVFICSSSGDSNVRP